MSDRLHTSLLAVQSALKAPKNQKNTFGNYNYRSCEDILEAVKPLLKEHGLTLNLSDDVLCIGDRFYIRATATISNGTEKETSTALAREPVSKKGMDESQITGTASSYARKYALNGLFCIDDTKDADTDAYRLETGKKDQATHETPVDQAMVNLPVCSDCGSVISSYGKRTAQQMAKASKEKFGRVLCLSCANKEAARLEVS